MLRECSILDHSLQYLQFCTFNIHVEEIDVARDIVLIEYILGGLCFVGYFFTFLSGIRPRFEVCGYSTQFI